MTQAAFDFDKHGHLVAISPMRRSTTLRALHSAPPQPLAKPPAPGDLRLDRRLDALLTSFGKATLDDRYLLPGESSQDMFVRVACARLLLRSRRVATSLGNRRRQNRLDKCNVITSHLAVTERISRHDLLLRRSHHTQITPGERGAHNREKLDIPDELRA
ncbi:MAG TPA: hypothetical protein VIF40_03460 [Methylosinus sp.]|jgi:hypothetical protein|uniref:hypothetical protein n=1 Tax=Methylosinus sp. TaxID=427 RepID=UPI002F929C86